MLDIKNAVKVFSPGTPNEHKALNNLSIHLDAGEYVTIVGSNGAGKSTLIKILGGIYSGIFTPTESAAPGFSPTARSFRPTRVQDRYHQASTATASPR